MYMKELDLKLTETDNLTIKIDKQDRIRQKK